MTMPPWSTSARSGGVPSRSRPREPAVLDLPEVLGQLRILERLALIILRDIRIKIAEVENRQAAMRPMHVLPEGPGWVVSYLRERGRRVPAAVHVGDCAMAGKNVDRVSQDEDRLVLADGSIRGCDFCRPDAGAVQGLGQIQGRMIRIVQVVAAVMAAGERASSCGRRLPCT